MTKRLPGGRGPKYGTDALVTQRESYDERASRLSPQDKWIVGTTGDTIVSTEATGFTADRLYLIKVPEFSHDIRAYSVRVIFTNATAGSKVHLALYRYHEHGHLHKVAYTEQTIHGDSVGLEEHILRKPVTLDHERHYFVAAGSDNITTRVAGVTRGQGHPIRVLYKDLADVLLDYPGAMHIDEFTKSIDEPVPVVCYMSYDAEEDL